LRSRRRRARLRARAAEAGVSVGEVRAADEAAEALLDDLYPMRVVVYVPSPPMSPETVEKIRRFLAEHGVSASRLFGGVTVIPANADVRVLAVGGRTVRPRSWHRRRLEARRAAEVVRLLSPAPAPPSMLEVGEVIGKLKDALRLVGEAFHQVVRLLVRAAGCREAFDGAVRRLLRRELLSYGPPARAPAGWSRVPPGGATARGWRRGPPWMPRGGRSR
jgi:peptidoglycan hydrolase-like protein with peptidoglycan-binding domain